MKKFLALAAIPAILMAFAACDDSGSSPSSEKEGNGGETKKKTCIDRDQCDAIVKDDYSTWRYDEMKMSGTIISYSYSVEGTDFFMLVDGKISDSYFNNYDMSTPQGQRTAYNAVVERCRFKTKNPGTVFCDEE